MRPRATSVSDLRSRIVAAALASLVLFAGARACAGPPFVTDDPDTTDYKHWEIDFFTIYTHTAGDDFAQLPALELDYGILPDLQLHAIAPGAFNHAPGAGDQYGYGDTELGVKYRFFHETDKLPEMGLFPLVEVPSGDSGRGLGNGQTQIFVPVWFQKTFGQNKEWTTFGGGGFWYNPGVDHRNYGRFGWELQRDLSERLTLGGEIYHETESLEDAGGHTAFNLGGYLNFDEHNHILFSAGRDIQGPNRFSCYLGYQLTF
jgi:hypothetical protein